MTTNQFFYNHCSFRITTKCGYLDYMLDNLAPSLTAGVWGYKGNGTKAVKQWFIDHAANINYGAKQNTITVHWQGYSLVLHYGATKSTTNKYTLWVSAIEHDPDSDYIWQGDNNYYPPSLVEYVSPMIAAAQKSIVLWSIIKADSFYRSYAYWLFQGDTNRAHCYLSYSKFHQAMAAIFQEQFQTDYDLTIIDRNIAQIDKYWMIT